MQLFNVLSLIIFLTSVSASQDLNIFNTDVDKSMVSCPGVNIWDFGHYSRFNGSPFERYDDIKFVHPQMPVSSQLSSVCTSKSNDGKYVPSTMSCCSEQELIDLRSQYLAMEITIEASLLTLNKLVLNQDDMLIAQQEWLMWKYYDDHLVQQLESITEMIIRIPQLYKLIEELASFSNAVLGYFSAIACSVCDPMSSLYLLQGSSAANNGKWELHLQPGFNVELSKDLTAFIDELSIFFSNNIVRRAIIDFLQLQCGQAGDMELACGQDSLTRFFDALIPNKRVDVQAALYEFWCGASASDDRKLKCEDLTWKSFRGLVFDPTPLNSTVQKYISDRCPKNIEPVYCRAMSSFVAGVANDLRSSVHFGPNIRKADFSSLVIHVADTSKSALNVFDVATKSTLSKTAFEQAVYEPPRAPKPHPNPRPKPIDPQGNGTAGHHSSLIMRLFKATLFLGVCAGLVYVGFIAYKKRQEREFSENGEFGMSNFYSSLPTSRV